MRDDLLRLPGSDGRRAVEDPVKVRRTKWRGLPGLFVMAGFTALMKDNLSSLGLGPQRTVGFCRGTVDL